MKKKLPIIIALTFIGYISLFFLIHIALKDKDFSHLENRMLAQYPTPTLSALKEGALTRNFESYIADQFPFRNGFISMKSNMERLLQKKDQNGVYIGKNGYFLQDFKKPDEELLNKNMQFINRFAENFNTYLMVAPTATSILKSNLPSFATPYDERVFLSDIKEKASENVHFVPLYQELENKNKEYIFYKTDHHWTTLGAYYAYIQFCKEYGILPKTKSDFSISRVSDNFYGSLFSKGNFTFAKSDSIHIFEPKEREKIKVTYVVENKTTHSFYEMSHLKKKDQYQLFLDNNHPVIKINTNVINGKRLLIIKDSYANSFIPFLASHFEEMHILDLRFLNMSIQNYANEHNLKDVLILYNVQNFSKSREFVWLK